jgi:hypothetical protein
MSKILDTIRLPLLLVGLLTVFIMERYFPSDRYHELGLGVGAALIAISTLICFVRSKLAAGLGLKAESKSWLYVLGWQAIVLLGIIIYFIYRVQLGQSPQPESFVQKFLLGSYLICLILGFSMGIGTEFVHSGSGIGFLADAKRVGRSSMSWLLIGMLVAILVSVNYSAAKRDRSFDLSYLKSTEPGSSSINMVKTLTDKMEIILFFPSDNEVLPFVEKYARQLAVHSPQIEIRTIDVELNPAAAETFKVSRNGLLLIAKGEQRERIEVKLSLRQARETLRKFDGEFQKAFLKLNASKKVAYFTKGHGEMTWSSDDPAGFRSLRFVERLMRAQQYTVKSLGVAEGSSNEIPDDATLVVIAGPTGPFMQEEVEALKRFSGRGGKILVLFDVSAGELDTVSFIEQKADPLQTWLASVGIEFKSEVLANDKNFVSVKKAQSDRWFLFSNIFTSHESVVNLAKNEERVPVLFFQTGHLAITPGKDSWKSIETIRALKDSFVDLNRNYQFDANTEKRDTYVLGAAATLDTGKKNGDLPIEAKILALADATAMSDGIIASGVPGNQILIADGLRWLVDESKYSGETSSEEDIKIRHTQKEDGVLFYGTIFAMPALVLAAGYVATRRRKGGTRA